MSKTTSNKTMTGSGLIIAAAVGTATWLAFRRPAKAATKQPPPPPSPFIPGSNCTTLADGPTTLRWLTEVVEPIIRPYLDTYAIPPHKHEVARMAVEQLVDAVFQQTLPECAQVDTYVSRQLWKGLWCEVVAQLVMRGKLDEELDDVLALCLDPTFDPRAPKDPSKPLLKHPVPPFPGPMGGAKPRPMHPRRSPTPAVAPMEVSTGGAPPNLWAATTREELSRIGLMRMMEGHHRRGTDQGPQRPYGAVCLQPGMAGSRAGVYRSTAPGRRTPPADVRGGVVRRLPAALRQAQGSQRDHLGAHRSRARRSRTSEPHRSR